MMIRVKRFKSIEEEIEYINKTVLKALSLGLVYIISIFVVYFSIYGYNYIEHIKADNFQRLYYTEHKEEIDEYFTKEDKIFKDNTLFVDVADGGINLSSSHIDRIVDREGNIICYPVNVKVGDKYYVGDNVDSLVKGIYREVEPINALLVNAIDYIYYTSNAYSPSFESKDISRYANEKDSSLNSSIEQERTYELSTRYWHIKDNERWEHKMWVIYAILLLMYFLYVVYTETVIKVREYKKE